MALSYCQMKMLSMREVQGVVQKCHNEAHYYVQLIYANEIFSEGTMYSIKDTQPGSVALSFEHRDWTLSLGPQSLSSSCFLRSMVALCCTLNDSLQILSIGHILPRPSLHTRICSADFSCPCWYLSVNILASERTALALSPRQDDQGLTSHQGLL